MQKTAKVLLLAALFLNGSALARQDNNEGDKPRPHKGPKGGKPHTPADICGRIAEDCVEDGIEGPFNSEVTSLLDLCNTELCTPYLESHKCFVGCAGECHRNGKNKKDVEKCGQGCLECVDNGEEAAPEEEVAPEEEPTERKSIVSIIRNAASREEVRRAVSRRQEENANEVPAEGEEGEEGGEGEENNHKPHHGKGGKKGGKGGKGGKKGGHHGGPPTAEGFCKRVVEKCDENAEAGSRNAKDDLCDQAKCEEWFSAHQTCFFQCAGECHKDHKGDKEGAEACVDEKCFDCTEEAPAARHIKVVRRAARRQEEGEAPPAEEGEPRPEGPKDPCGPIQKKCSPHERAAARSRRQEEEGGVTKFDDLCDEQFCHGFFEHHKCSMKCLYDCHVAHKDNLDSFKECADPCLACEDQAPARRRRQGGPRPPPTPEEFCGKVADKCAKEAEGAGEAQERRQEEGEGEEGGEPKTTKHDLCEPEKCVEWYKDHSHCFFQCVGECRQENPDNREGTEQCVEERCFNCVEGPAPARRRRALRHH